MDDKRKAMKRKPKVAPVIGSQVKLDKMLKKQMKSLSLGSAATKSRKINMEDDESSGSSEDEGMQGVTSAAMSVPRIEGRNSINGRIKKQRQGLSRAQEIVLKKQIRKRLSMGSKDAKKDAKKLRNRLNEGIGKRMSMTYGDEHPA